MLNLAITKSLIYFRKKYTCPLIKPGHCTKSNLEKEQNTLSQVFYQTIFVHVKVGDWQRETLRKQIKASEDTN